MEVVVFGAGSLGSLVGGLLARDHDVTLVGRTAHVAAVKRDGLRVTGIEEFVTTPEATTDGENLEAELAIVTVKAYDTPSAARELATGQYDVAVSLQNGMGNEDVLAEHLVGAILAGATTHGALLREPGVVEWTGRGDVILGGWRPAETPLAARVATAFDTAGLDASVAADIHTQLWLKLAVNAAINPLTALARVPNGALLSNPAAAVAREAASETARVARAIGFDLPDAEVVGRAEAVAGATADNRSSMFQDVAEGRRTEIDSINGYVVDRAADHGIDVPVNLVLTTLIEMWETGRGLR